MDFIELEQIWQNYDRKISENSRINREILKRLLIAKPEKRFNRIKLTATIQLFSPAIFLFLLITLKVRFEITQNFYVGLCLFLPVYLIAYFWDLQYFRLIRKIEFSQSILTIKKKVAELEKHKIKTTRIRYLLMPLAMAGFLIMLIQKPVLNSQSLVLFGLIVLVFFSSLYVTFKFSIHERFKALNQEIDEIRKMEIE